MSKLVVGWLGLPEGDAMEEGGGRGEIRVRVLLPCAGAAVHVRDLREEERAKDERGKWGQWRWKNESVVQEWVDYNNNYVE